MWIYANVFKAWTFSFPRRKQHSNHILGHLQEKMKCNIVNPSNRPYSQSNPSKRRFPVRTVHSREFVCIFCFVSCKTSQNVNISQLLTWSKFKVLKQPPLWMRSGRGFMLRSFSYHLMKQLRSWSQLSCRKKELKGLKDKVCTWFVTNNIDLHSIEWDLRMFINIRMLRLRSTEWKSLSYFWKSLEDLEIAILWH